MTPVILEGIRRVDEWQRIREVFPNLETTFKVNGPAPAAADPVEKQVLALAAAGKSLAEMSLELRRSEFETAALVFDLHSRGLVAVGQVRAGDPGRRPGGGDPGAARPRLPAAAGEALRRPPSRPTRTSSPSTASTRTPRRA